MSLLTLKNKIGTLYKDYIILGCGPSLNSISPGRIAEFAWNKKVIAIKQAIYYYRHSSILCLNTCNLSDYTEYLDSKDEFKPHSIFQIAYPEMPYYNITKYDTILPIINVNRFDWSLSETKNIDKWSFNNTHNRNWGPGLIYETVFYLCHYLGAKNIYTIGWDLGTSNDGRQHFYKDNEYSVINKAQPLEPKETSQEVELSRLFYEWLKSKDINLTIASENSYAHKDIPRIKIS